MLRNLDRLVSARASHASVLEIRGVMVLMRSNLQELPALVRLLHERGVEELLVQRLASDMGQPELPQRYIPIRDYVRAAQLHMQDLPLAHRVFDQARDEAARLGLRLHLPRLEPAPATAAQPAPRCTWPWDQLYVTAAGELLPCCMVATADRASFGRVFDTHSGGLTGRWQGEPAKEFRRALAEDEPPEVCRSCALYQGLF